MIKLRQLVLVTSLIILVAGCEREKLAPGVMDQLHDVVFHAGWDSETKTVLQEDGSVWWSPGDSISLFVGSGSNGGYKLTSTNNEPAAHTDFVGQISGSGDTYIAIYPFNETNRVDGNNVFFTIPTEQIAKEGTFADGALVSVAVSNDEHLYFHNMCAGIKFSVAHEGIKKVEIIGTNLSGGMMLNRNEDRIWSVSGGNTITIHAPNNAFETGKYYYAVVAVCEPHYIDGQPEINPIRVNYCTDNSVATTWLPGRLFQRSEFRRLYEADKELKFKREYDSMALLPYEFLPNEIDKTTITEAYFHVSDPTTTATIISEGDSEYEPIYFEKVGTVVHYYTTGEVYKCYGVNFWGWQSLRSLDLSMFDISDVQFLPNTFRDCFSLRSLNLSSFDTSNVTDFSYMFYNCLSLKELNVTGFDTSKAIDMSYMFAYCKSLSNLDVRGFNTGLVTVFDGMFGDCSNLKQLDVSNFDTSSATDMTTMFSGLSLTSLDVSNFNTSNVVRASGLFSNCWNLQEIDVSHFDTRKMEIMSYMFAGCRSLVHLDLTSFDFASVQYMDGMFKNSSNLKDIEMPSSTTPSLLMTHYMFEGCNSLEHIDLSFFDTRNVTTMIQMFRGCSSLRALDLSSFNVEHVSSFWGLFDGCRNLEYLNISSFNPANISDAKEMFYNTRKLTKLDLGDFDISLSSDNTGIGHWLGELAKQCHIRCTQATKDALIAASSLLSNSKYTWYTDGSSLPNVDYENEDGLYCSSDYSKDKTVRTIQLASEGAGIDLVVMGDAYSDRLIADGTYDADMEKAIDAIFAVEPYKTFKHLFNIFIVYAVSENEVIGKSTALSCFNEGSPIGSEDWIWKSYYASAAKVSSPGECSPIIIMNSATSDGSASGFLSIAPNYMDDPLRDDYHGGVSEAVAYISGPNDARFDYIVRHEFGHSFGFLMDEYSKYSGAITSWDIESWQCCFAYGMWKNVDLVSDNTIKWAKFINDPRYAGTGIGVYEGALYETGAWRSSPESIMNSTDSGFNAPSREAIYYKIHKLAYGKDWEYNYEDFVTYDLANIEADRARRSAPKDRIKQVPISFAREPIFRKSIVTGPDGKDRVKIEMN